MERAFKVAAGDRLCKQHRAGFVHGDAHVFDLIESEVEPRRQAGGRGPQYGQVGAVGRHLDRDVVTGSLWGRGSEHWVGRDHLMLSNLAQVTYFTYPGSSPFIGHASVRPSNNG
jgi:hypothetical protein